MKRKSSRKTKKVAPQPTMTSVVQEAINANTIPTRRMSFCECGCSPLLHTGVESDGKCLLHPDCKSYKERAE